MSHPNQTDRKLTRQEAADYLGVSVFTLNQWASEDTGPAFFKVGRKCVYRQSDLDAYLADNAHGSSGEARASVPTQPAPQGDYLIRLSELIRKTGMSRSTIYARVKRGEFVTPVQLGPRSVAWSAAAVDRWIAERIAQAGKEVA